MNLALTLVIANKNYSSWSLRAWLVLRELQIPFTERLVKFDSEDWDLNLPKLSPSGLVPVLWEGEVGQGFATFDTMAILERLHELFPIANVWPVDERKRARARSLVADFHSGYAELRTRMPMNIRSHYPGEGMSVKVQAEIDRLTHQWVATKDEFGGGGAFLFGGFSAADAYFTPVASRFKTYDVALPEEIREYQENLLNTAAMQAWSNEAILETEVVLEDEPYLNEQK